MARQLSFCVTVTKKIGADQLTQSQIANLEWRATHCAHRGDARVCQALDQHPGTDHAGSKQDDGHAETDPP